MILKSSIATKEKQKMKYAKNDDSKSNYVWICEDFSGICERLKNIIKVYTYANL